MAEAIQGFRIDHGADAALQRHVAGDVIAHDLVFGDSRQARRGVDRRQQAVELIIAVGPVVRIAVGLCPRHPAGSVAGVDDRMQRRCRVRRERLQLRLLRLRFESAPNGNHKLLKSLNSFSFLS
jgi:hypothetical protein